ncbi:MAG: hypothetical protein GDA46_00760 [Bdellovibrionales bacterium]|nr:hypothetical protein [Bdellovibrionales bacterium]
MKSKKNYQIIRNQKGVAYVEMLPLLVLFVILYGITLGLWSSIHQATLKSIATRHYSFEVLNNRTHYVYHRDNQAPIGNVSYYGRAGRRFFANVEHQATSNPSLINSKAFLSLFDSGITQIETTLSPNQTNPIRIKTGYGICINYNCGGFSIPSP